MKTRLRHPFVVVCAVPAFAEVAQDAAAEQLDASASAVIRRQLHLFVSCNVDKAAVHLVAARVHELRHPEKRGPEVVVANATVFRAIAESRRCTQKLSYGYEPVNLCLSDVSEVALKISAIKLCCSVDVTFWYTNRGAERGEEHRKGVTPPVL